MVIWVIGRGYPTKQNSARGSFELEQAKLLAGRGHRVAYLSVTLHPYKKIRKWGSCSFTEDGVEIFSCSVPFLPERLNLHPRKLLKVLWDRELAAVLAQTGMPDVIHIHYPAMNTVPESVLPYQQQGAKLVTTEHWTKVLTCSLDAYERNQLKIYTQNADAVLCVGYPLIQSIQQLAGVEREIQVVPNMYPALFCLPEAQQKSGRFDFIAIGRLVPVKQMYETVNAFTEAFRGNQAVHLTIVGGGSEFKRIHARIAQLGMQSQITMTGMLNREETAARLKQADALVCFSRLETFGVPVIEAWACGKPVIASDALGFLEYWQDGLGELVNQHDVDALSKAMQRLCEHKAQYDPQFISQFAESNFNEAAVYRRLLDVYRNV